MTALTKYARLEAVALWRPSADAQRRDVVLVLGDATLTVKDGTDRALTHWSLAAIIRANPGKRPAIFHPDGDPAETIEISSDEDEMIRALEKLRKAVERTRPRKGRLRGLITALVLAGAVAAASYILPGAVTDHAMRVVPDVKRAEIGEALLTEMQRVTGPPCAAQIARPPLVALAQRMAPQDGPIPLLAVTRAGVDGAVSLPGGVILLSRSLVEDHESPDVVAGFILAEQERSATVDPLRRYLEHSGTLNTLRFLTSGSAPVAAIRSHAQHLLTSEPVPTEPLRLLQRFERAMVPSSPYAYALDLSGEAVLPLIEADPFRRSGPAAEVLDDSSWVRLQTICGS